MPEVLYSFTVAKQVATLDTKGEKRLQLSYVRTSDGRHLVIEMPPGSTAGEVWVCDDEQDAREFLGQLAAGVIVHERR